MNKKSIILGLAAGVASAIFSIAFEKQLLDSNNMLLSFVPTAFYILATIYIVYDTKKQNGGYMTIKQGFVPAFIFGSISCIVSVIFSLLNIYVIKTKEQLDEMIKIMADGMIEKGTPPAQATEIASKAFSSPLISLAGVAGGIAMSALIAVAVAAVMQKKQNS
ncbi:MAG: DUF4199 domain-containing protein [Cytophagales bacterium]|nr:DUF4199 domain-containing protein [Cytophagales bacterium]